MPPRYPADGDSQGFSAWRRVKKILLLARFLSRTLKEGAEVSGEGEKINSAKGIHVSSRLLERSEENEPPTVADIVLPVAPGPKIPIPPTQFPETWQLEMRLLGHSIRIP